MSCDHLQRGPAREHTSAEQQQQQQQQMRASPVPAALHSRRPNARKDALSPSKRIRECQDPICCEPDARGSCAPVGASGASQRRGAAQAPDRHSRESMRLWKGGECTYGAKMYHSHPELFFDLAVLTHAHVTRRTPARGCEELCGAARESE